MKADGVHVWLTIFFIFSSSMAVMGDWWMRFDQEIGRRGENWGDSVCGKFVNRKHLDLHYGCSRPSMVDNMVN